MLVAFHNQNCIFATHKKSKLNANVLFVPALSTCLYNYRTMCVKIYQQNSTENIRKSKIMFLSVNGLWKSLNHKPLLLVHIFKSCHAWE